MTNYDRLKQVMITENGADLLHWLENFAYWFDSGGWFEESEVREYLSEDYKQKEEDAPFYPEPLTDKEKRIFLSAMSREENVCKQVDDEWRDCREPYDDSLVKTCHEITRKVKGALWT